MRLSPVTLFFLKVLAWMPVTFSLWYFSAEVGLWPVTQLVDGFLSFQTPHAIQSVTQVGHQIQVSVYLAVPDLTAQLSGGSAGGMVLEGKFLVNALKYGYCIPLFTALLLATPGHGWRKVKIWFMGLLILQLTQAWGVSFEVLKILLFDQGPEAPGMLGYGFLSLNSAGLAYQFGFLILPAVAPVVIWMAFHTDYLRDLAPGLSRTLK
ncbi:MAG: hypothetical protein KAX64_00805 [Chromatiaceae bacterium]|nr:hypothetical protein [Chromatiaceae bacterium]MBP8197078.1 hypothetical protein [Chromatiaceae bacterium]